jgi:hypothetical protein
MWMDGYYHHAKLGQKVVGILKDGSVCYVKTVVEKTWCDRETCGQDLGWVDEYGRKVRVDKWISLDGSRRYVPSRNNPLINIVSEKLKREEG